MDSKTCPGCGSGNELIRFFCEKCGAFLETGFEAEAYELSEMKAKRIVYNLKNMEPSEDLPDEDLAFFAEKAERLQALLALPEFGNNAQSADNIKELISLCRQAGISDKPYDADYRRSLLEDIENRFKGVCYDLRRVADNIKRNRLNLLAASQADLNGLKIKAEETRKNFEAIKNKSLHIIAMIDIVKAGSARPK